MEQLISNNITVTWLILGGILIALEALSIPGIGFLFAGLAAVTTGGLLAFGLLDTQSFLTQLLIFLLSTALWAALLWAPLQRYMKRNSSTSYKNIVGKTAVVSDEGLKKGVVGKVKWSGTWMTARLSETSSVEELEAGQEVVINSISGTELTVSPK